MLPDDVLRQLLARAETAVKLEQLHQIDDRLLPVQVLPLLGGGLLDQRSLVDHVRDFRYNDLLLTSGIRLEIGTCTH